MEVLTMIKSIKKIILGALTIAILGGSQAQAEQVQTQVINVNGKEITAQDKDGKQYTFQQATEDTEPIKQGENITLEVENVTPYTVNIYSIDKLDNTATINKDGNLYKFYVDNIDDIYLNESIIIYMSDNGEIINYNVVDLPRQYNDVPIIYKDNKCYCIRINNNVYSFDNEEDDADGYKVGELVRVIMQNDNILEVRPTPPNQLKHI